MYIVKWINLYLKLSKLKFIKYEFASHQKGCIKFKSKSEAQNVINSLTSEIKYLFRIVKLKSKSSKV